MESSPEPDEYETSVIRLEIYHVDEVISFPGPVGYEESRLSASLVAGLRWWSLRSSGQTNETNYQSPPGLPDNLEDAGRVLARRVADEVGDDFEVELWTDSRQKRVRSGRRAKNPDAAQFFRSRAEVARTEWEQRAW
ncbi:hypothetical protein [Marisediminicola sp. LYQ134]|uniref:hypothetical protein n=1 Tax=Marisediminicola sp. LYQ134 TaxID=3391061 RepID=UPI0039835256